MKRIIILSVMAAAASAVAVSQPASQNYVKTTTYTNSQGSASVCSVQFYDGLGRPSVKAGGGNDAAGTYAYTRTVYDMQGMPAEQWLPAAGGTHPRPCA